MPLPKNYDQKKYGLIVGHLTNLGIPWAQAKLKADKAMMDAAKGSKKKKKPSVKKKKVKSKKR